MSKKVKLDDGVGPSTSLKRPSTENEDSRTLDSLPVDVLLDILKWIPLGEIVQLRAESSLLNEAVSYYTKSAMIRMRQIWNKKVTKLQNILRTDFGTSKSLPLVKQLYVARFISTEIEVIFATVWRYRVEVGTWNELLPYLSNIMTGLEVMYLCDFESKFTFRIYDMKRLFPAWQLFLEIFDSGLSDRLNAISRKSVPFEIKMIDLMLCAPGCSSQIEIKRRHIETNELNDVYGFFKAPILNPFYPVPDSYNAELTLEEKKKKLLIYLRETIRYSNLMFLYDIESTIRNCHIDTARLSSHNQDSETRRIITKMEQCYNNTQSSPYSYVDCCYSRDLTNGLYKENYSRNCNQNMNITGMYSIVFVPNQEVSNLPIHIPFLRGRRQNLNDIFNCRKIDSDSLGNNENFHYFMESASKPQFQMIIHYMENRRFSPNEILINISYDDDGKGYLSYHYLSGEALQLSPE